MKTKLTLLFWAFAAAALAQAEKKDPLAGDPDLPNFSGLSAVIATAGQPTDEGLKKLKEAGFKTILNLRTPEEGSLEEKTKAESLGLIYVNIPITTGIVTEEKVKVFSETVADPSNKPLLIHCASANRVGGMWYIHRSLKDGVAPEESLEEAKAIGLASPVLEEIVRKFVEERKK